MANYLTFNSKQQMTFTIVGYDGNPRDITYDKIEFYLKAGKLTTNTTYKMQKTSDQVTEILINPDQVNNKGKGTVYIDGADFFNNDGSIKIVPTLELANNDKYYYSFLCYPQDDPTNPIQSRAIEVEIRSSVKSN